MIYVHQYLHEFELSFPRSQVFQGPIKALFISSSAILLNHQAARG